MRFLRLFSLLFLFFVDVHVKAAELEDCWGKTTPCAIAANGEKRVLKNKSVLLSMSGNSLVEQRDTKTIELVLGHFYVETLKPIRLQTPYAKFWCEGECKALFTRHLTEVEIKSLGGSWRIQRQGEPQTYALPAGLQVSISEVTSDGQAMMEFPQSLPWASTLQEWSALFPGDLASLKEGVAKFRPVWKQAVEAASQLHQQAARREIASYQKGQADERAKERAKAHEDEELRALFREKNP